MEQSGNGFRIRNAEEFQRLVQSRGKSSRPGRRRHRRGPVARTPPILLDTSPWGPTIAGSGDGRCDLVATLAMLALLNCHQWEPRKHRGLLIVADTSMEARMLGVALHEAGLGEPRVHTLEDLPWDLHDMQVVLVSATADDTLRDMSLFSAAGALPYAIVCNTSAKVGRQWDTSAHAWYQILRADATVIRTLAGSAVRWVVPLDGLPPNTGEWERVTVEVQEPRRSLLLVPCLDGSVLISTVGKQNTISLATSIAISLPQTVGLFLDEGVGLDPFYTHSVFHTGNLLFDPVDSLEPPAAVSDSRAGGQRTPSRATPAPRLELPEVNRVKTGASPTSADHTRHYEDEYWYDTEREKDAQDRRQSGRISYSDVGIKRQSPRDSGITPEQMEQLRRMRGTPGEDQ